MRDIHLRMREAPEELWIHRLLEVGRSLTAELDLGTVLERVLQAGREITGARYAALAIPDDRRVELEQLLATGVDDDDTRRPVRDLPRGRGPLGALTEHPRPLRLANASQHPSSCGFRAGHHVMSTFLGVPIMIRGQAWGNLYLTEKEGHEEFSSRDEEAAAVLAAWSAIAIENAWLHEVGERRRRELEKATSGLEATRDVAVAIGGEIALGHVLELIVKRGRALVGARSLVIMLRDGEELVVHASAGRVREMRDVRLPVADSASGQVLEHLRPERITDVALRLRTAASEFGVPDDAQTALLVPMVYRGEAMGVLAAFDRGEDGGAFGEDDEQLLRTFAASAATAVALAQSVQADRLRSSQAAADAERRRWARELHDETLQGLGGLRLLLASALRVDDLPRTQVAMREAVAHIEREIGNLRAIITELRPAALDELGLRTAIEALLDRHREQSEWHIESELALPRLVREERLEDDLETTVYRLVQEALMNVAKHAHANRVRIAVGESDGELLIEVQDDGDGFDAETVSQGFGLAGMHERASLAGGTLDVRSDERGTLLRARLPARRRAVGERVGGSGLGS
jgi:signal transduction histidine kinase